ncbi:MAG: thioredoxin family protein [Hydrocarboniphaga effusa]|nr:thioredoxin family protein [Hydrocarboniphaga effusa]
MKAISFLLLLAVCAPGFTQEPAPDSGPDPVAAAQARARERHAPLLVDFQAPWCYSCYYMAKNVLNGAEWERVQREAVVLELDADSPEGARWMQAWSVKALPSYVMLDAGGQELGRILGEQTRGDFYPWAFSAIAGGNTLDALKAKVTDSSEPSLSAAREVLKTLHARYDAIGGLNWYAALPPPVRAAVTRDAQSAAWITRLELQRAAAEKDEAACVKAGKAVLALNLGCERPYELDKVMACTGHLPEERRRELLKPQSELMQLLLEKRVLSDYRCADERSIVLTAADLQKVLGDTVAESLILERAVADVKTRIGDDLKKDRNLADNQRVYLDRAGKLEELDLLLTQLIAAWPGDYVYAYRHGKNLAARGQHAEALPFFEQAAAKAYGVNRLHNAELRARSLQALDRVDDARQVLGEALQANGPWFPEAAEKLKALLAELAPAPAAVAPAAS